MTQEVIENHLLKVGSSRYQEQKFREKYANFHPISRFGIGVLTSFMVADTVEIVTVSTEEEQARQISLRSVHGKYLIRLLDKGSTPEVRRIGSHGTLFTLQFRPSAKNLNVLSTLRKWIVFPRCAVKVSIDDGHLELVGHKSPKTALLAYLSSKAPIGSGLDEQVRVEEVTVEGLTLAYALNYNAHFRDWSFVASGRQRHGFEEWESDPSPIATCVEGIAVEFEIPGYEDTQILALANAVGTSAPKTNVARSAIEKTELSARNAAIVYKILMDSVAGESKRLVEAEGYSLTWSVEQIPFMISPLLGGNSSVPDAHSEALQRVPMFLVEIEHAREAQSLNQLLEHGQFWTSESQLMTSVEHFIREAKAEVTARQLIRVSQGTTSSIPNGTLLTNAVQASVISRELHNSFEVDSIKGIVPERRLDLLWRKGQGSWLSVSDLRTKIYRSADADMMQTMRRFFEGQRQENFNVSVPLTGVTSSGLEGYFAALAQGSTYLLPETPLVELIGNLNATSANQPRALLQLLIALSAVHYVSRYLNRGREGGLSEMVDTYFRQVSASVPRSFLVHQSAIATCLDSLSKRAKVYDPFAWTQREHDPYDFD